MVQCVKTECQCCELRSVVEARAQKYYISGELLYITWLAILGGPPARKEDEAYDRFSVSK